MKTFSIKIFVLLGLLFPVCSCSLLDTEPQDFIDPGTYYDTEEKLDIALNGVYATLAQTTLYGGDMLARMGLSADLGYESYSTDEGTVGYYDASPSDPRILNYWRDLYAGIGRANRLLENLHKPEMDEKERDNIRGQALFLRAYYHFLLVTRFGDVPLVLTVPPSGKLTDVQLPQTPKREVYLRIISDMETAAGLVKPASEVECGGRISQSAVWGILARVCLYMAGEPVNEPGMYAKAKEYAQKVIDTQFHKLNTSFEQVFINYIQDKYDIKESIFEVEFWGNNVGTYTTTAGRVGRDNGIGLSNADLEIGVSPGMIRATAYFLSLFEENDLRRDLTIAPFTYTKETGEKVYQTTNYWIRYCGKFRREYELTSPKSVTYTPINFPILRYSDVLLMYAEGVAADPANASDEELALAYEYLNQVRRRGYGKDINTPDDAVDFEKESKLDLMEHIKDERARELGFEIMRKDDIIRWGEFLTRMQSIAPSVPESYTSSYYVAARTIYKNAKSRDVLWPIPSYEIGVNRNLVQNKGW